MRPRFIVLVYSLATLVYGASASVSMAQELALEHLKIVLDTKKSRKDGKTKEEKKAAKKDWKTACDNLGKALVAGSGPWGFGAFSGYGCYRGKSKKKLAGEDKPARWELRVINGKKDFEFKFTYQPTGGAKVDVAQLTFPGAQQTLKYFADDEFTDATAFSLLERLPGGMQVTKAAIKGTPPTFVGRYVRAGNGKRFKYTVIEAPEELVLFRIAWDDKEKRWRSTVVGTAKRTQVNEPKKKKKKKQQTLVGGDVTYETNDAVLQALAQGPLWAQGSGGPGALAEQNDEVMREAAQKLGQAAEQDKLDEFINGKVSSLVGDLLDTAASGYVAARIGMQVLQGEDQLSKGLMSKLMLIGVLTEVRGGPLEGLRYYYDKIPETKGELEGATGEKIVSSIASARHTLGYSFNIPIGFVFDKVTIDPQFGVWTFNAEKLPAELDAQGKVVKTENFELGSTGSLALEVGLETGSDWYTVRGWYSINSGFSLLKQGGRVVSNRFGIDAYFTAGPTFPIFGIPFKTALLAFYLYESVTLTAGKAEEQTEQPKITGISYQNGFAGGGIGVSW